MANLTAKKSDAISKMVSLAPRAMELLAEIIELNGFLTDNGFLTGGANAIADPDFLGDNAHATAADFNAAMAALGTMTLNASQKATMRRVSKVPVPFTPAT